MPSWAIILFLAAELPLFSFALNSPRMSPNNFSNVSLAYETTTVD